MKASVALFAIVALLFLAQSALAHNDGIQRRKAPPSAKVPRLHSVNRPSLRPVPALQSAKASAVTGWAKRLTLPRKLIARPTIDAVGSRPRFVSYGNWQLDSNTIGTPDPKTSLRGLSHYNLAFWVSQGGNATSAGDVTTGSGNAQAWAQGSKTLQRTIVKEYNKYGIRLGVAVFGAADAPQSNGNDPVVLARTIAAFVKQNNLQGVDVDYEEFDLLTDWSGKAAAWLVPFTQTLRVELPRPQYYISHAPVAPLFNADLFPNGFLSVHKQVGKLIDFYNVQFYNQNGAYQNCTTLLTRSDVYPSSSLFELVNKWGIPASKIVLGKPAHTDDAITYLSSTGAVLPDGYMTPSLEQTCLKQARKLKWRGGAMWWQYKGMIQDVLRPARAALQ